MTDRFFKMRRRSLLQLVLVCFGVILVVGCGQKTGPTGSVKGSVTLDDVPYTAEASVVFMSTETGQAGSADIQSDGTFRLEAPLPVGTYAVFIGPKSPTSEEGMEEPSEEKIDTSLPTKYRGETSTDIKVDIVEGGNDVVVAMKK